MQMHYEETFLGAMRILIADTKNAHFKYSGGPITPEDVFKLSYDTVADQKKIDPEVWKKIIDKRIGKSGKRTG